MKLKLTDKAFIKKDTVKYSDLATGELFVWAEDSLAFDRVKIVASIGFMYLYDGDYYGIGAVDSGRLTCRISADIGNLRFDKQ